MEKIASVLREREVLNSQRLLILLALYLSGRLCFADLCRVTGLPKGRVWHHVQVLEEEGLVRRRCRPTLMGPRLYIEITNSGEELVKELLDALAGLRGAES
ncbi:MAG: ArsR family transcriptional regulator [Thermoprotei archaeon]|nr:MAG: ArsR family transcriptional regulator [Thermoprotei archaeon]